MSRSLAILILATSSLASAGSETKPTSPELQQAVALVDAGLLRPLASKEHERGKFSRARPPAAQRRVRPLELARDSSGKAFVAFAVDERHGWFDESEGEDKWVKDQILGCAYLESREVFVKRGKAFHPAAAKLGKKTKAAPANTCQTTVVVTR